MRSCRIYVLPNPIATEKNVRSRPCVREFDKLVNALRSFQKYLPQGLSGAEGIRRPGEVDI